ncbi:MAG: O-methyltransferase [Melioribacteraceae bacterium]|nr:O-methyltransferase [Melioribacteraceae bacterium]
MKNIIEPVQETYLKNFRKEKNKLILEIEEYALENKIPILNWLAADFLEQLIKINKPKKVLEIGMAIGYSSIRIARALRKKGILYTIEKSPKNIERAIINFEKSGFNEKIKILEGDALELMPKLDMKFDFIFLDADKEDYEKLFHYSTMLLKKRGIIFIDNLLWHGYTASKVVPKEMKKSTNTIREFNKLFMESDSFDSKIYPIGDGIGIGIKK